MDIGRGHITACIGAATAPRRRLVYALGAGVSDGFSRHAATRSTRGPRPGAATRPQLRRHRAAARDRSRGGARPGAGGVRAIGPDTGIAPESRALITDYLLGQLPDRVAEQTRERLADSPYERAWARVLASELAPMASKPLPEIPDGSRAAAGSASRGRAAEPADGRAIGSGAAAPPLPVRRRRASAVRAARPACPTAQLPPGRRDHARRRRAGRGRAGGGPDRAAERRRIVQEDLDRPTASAAPGTTAPVARTSTPTTGSGTRIDRPRRAKAPGGRPDQPEPAERRHRPRGSGSWSRRASAYGIVIEAAHVAPNSHNAYAAWLYNSATDAYRLGFVNPAVGKNGQLQVGSPLPSNASHYKQAAADARDAEQPEVSRDDRAPGPVRAHVDHGVSRGCLTGRSAEDPLQPVQGLVEPLARRRAHGQRAGLRVAAQLLALRDRDLRAAVGRLDRDLGDRLVQDRARTAFPPPPAPTCGARSCTRPRAARTRAPGSRPARCAGAGS